MPVYGGIRARRKLPFQRNRITRVQTDPTKERYRRTYHSRKGKMTWKAEATSLQRVNRAIAPALGQTLQEWINERAKRTGHKAIVLDWGCGSGRAISELAGQTQGSSTCIGYSMDSYRSWKRNRTVSFIQEEHSHFLRFIRKPIDIIYSNAGLWHMRRNYSTEYCAKYYAKLAEKLSPSGIIVSYPARIGVETMETEPKLEDAFQKIIDPTRRKFQITFRQDTMIIKRLDYPPL